MSLDQPVSPLAAPALRCLGGQRASLEIGADLSLLPTLPLPALRQLYRVLGPCLGEPVPSSADAQIDQFCRELNVDVAALARVVRASRFILRQAAMQDLSEEELAEDLARLGDTGAIRAALSPGYDTVKTVVRGEGARGALADHGKVVERVAWRVDNVIASSRGENLSGPVAVLSLWYRDGERQDHVTLQLPPDALAELRALCARFP
jgi:hypothetical protein